MEFIPAWYRAYFEPAAPTGVRPSEPVALTWSAVADPLIHLELSRVRNSEKAEVKTAASNRRIDIRGSRHKILEAPKVQTAGFRSPYVCINTSGRPILPDKLRGLGARARKKSQLPYRGERRTRQPG